MIVIVANRWDQTPKSVASHWAPHAVAVVTAQDLSVPGWHQRLSVMDGGGAVAELKPLPQKEITGVLTLLPCIFEEELVDIAPEDRGYVAAEMTAFLLVWLSRLGCPVLNRPTPTCLSGPYWRREKWVSVAAQAGIPVETVRRHSAASGCSTEKDTLPVATTLTVVGNRVFGEGQPSLRRQALCLARLARVDLLAVCFSSAERGADFVSANVFPDLSDDGVADAVLEYLRREPARCA